MRVLTNLFLPSLITIVNQQAKRKNKQINKDQLHLTIFWLDDHDTWSDEELKERMRINR